MKVLLTMTGAEGLAAEMERRIELLHQQVERDVEWFGRTTSEEMVETHTFQNRTFRLEDSIGYSVQPMASTSFKIMGEVFATAPYASQVEFGHPGPPAARPYPFFYPVWYKWQPVLEEFLQTTTEFALYDGVGADH